MSEPLASDQNESAYHDHSEPPGEYLEIPLGEVPRRQPVEVAPHTAVSEVIAAMNEHSSGCALVVDDGLLVGIFTERDVLRKVAASGRDPKRIFVRDLMTPNPDTLPQEATVAFALNRMSVEGYRHIPIIDDDGHPVGVVGMRDIIHWLVETYPDKVLNVPPVPSSFPSTKEGA
jgi:CBS domain-containing protein